MSSGWGGTGWGSYGSLSLSLSLSLCMCPCLVDRTFRCPAVALEIDLTVGNRTILVEIMRPTQPGFSLRIDWTCYDAYGDPVTVDLQRLGAAHCISEHPSPVAAVQWAVKWLSDRGYTCKSDAGWYGPECQYVNLFPILKAAAV